MDIMSTCTNARLAIVNNQVMNMGDARDEIGEKGMEAELKATTEQATTEIAEAESENTKAKSRQEMLSELEEEFRSLTDDFQHPIQGVIDISNTEVRELLMDLLKYVVR